MGSDNSKQIALANQHKVNMHNLDSQLKLHILEKQNLLLIQRDNAERDERREERDFRLIKASQEGDRQLQLLHEQRMEARDQREERQIEREFQRDQEKRDFEDRQLERDGNLHIVKEGHIENQRQRDHQIKVVHLDTEIKQKTWDHDLNRETRFYIFAASVIIILILGAYLFRK